MYESSSIHRFYSRLKDVASYVGISKRTLKVHVNQLLELNLVHMEGNHLVISGKVKLCEFFGVEVKSHTYKHVLTTSTKAKDIKVQIRKLVITENQAKQKHILKDKEKNQTGKSIPRETKDETPRSGKIGRAHV